MYNTHEVLHAKYNVGRYVEETYIYAPLIDFAYKIILLYNDKGFYHFIRQNDDGKWSEVCGWGYAPTNDVDINNKLIKWDKHKTFYISRK